MKITLKEPLRSFLFACRITSSGTEKIQRCEMTRLYIQPSFVDSCSDHGEWSGGNGQYRGDRSVEVVPTYINGKPNVRAFSDEAIEARRAKKKTSIPLKARILPQLTRLEKIQAEILELELAYKSGEIGPEDYTVLRNIAFAKKERAEILYKRAISVKPRSQLEDDTEILDDSPVSCEEYTQENVVKDQGDDVDRGEDFAWLSDKNSLKKILQKGCKVVRKAVQLSQATRNYIKTLSEV